MDKLLDELDLGLGNDGEQQRRRDTLEHEPSPLRFQGAPTKEFHIEYERDLTEADLTALSLPRGTKPRSLLRIHSHHHALAKCIAVGMKNTDAALVTGYSPARIYQLSNDEAFKALIEEYRMEARSVVADATTRLINLKLHAIELLQDRMEDAPEALSVNFLLDLITKTADRTGQGPGQEVHIKMNNQDFIDRPPRETYDEWQERRKRELLNSDPDILEPPTRTTN